MFDSFALTIFVAVAALIVAIRALNQVAALRARLEALETSPRAAAAPVVPPPIPTDEFPIAPPIAIAETATGMREASPPVQPEPTPQAATEMPADRHRFRKPSPVSRNGSAPAGWSGSAG